MVFGTAEGRAAMSIKMYRQYRAARKVTAFDGTNMAYDWGALPSSLGFMWMPYREMFNEFSREIANSLNQLTDYTHRLKAWGAVIAPMTDRQKLDTEHEFVEPIATVALILPYVIRSRFIFAAAHLCHQANQSREGVSWQDDLPLDDEIYFAAADKYGTEWRQYKEFKRRVEKIGDKSHHRATRDFRNSYNHRFSPHVVIGITQIVTRQVAPKTKTVRYAFGTIPALTLESVVELLREQCKHGYAAFAAFQELVREHEASISEHQLRYPT
jgi:hypothetical protein